MKQKFSFYFYTNVNASQKRVYKMKLVLKNPFEAKVNIHKKLAHFHLLFSIDDFEMASLLDYMDLN